jgi:hypothetical protein
MLFKNQTRIETPIDIALDAIKTINLKKIKHVFCSDMSIHTLTVWCTTFREYNDLLTYINYSLKNNKQIYIAKLPSEIQEVQLQSMFLDSHGCHEDPVSMITEFINLTVAFLEMYQLTECRGVDDFVTNKNLLVTQQIVNNILDIIHKINEDLNE